MLAEAPPHLSFGPGGSGLDVETAGPDRSREIGRSALVFRSGGGRESNPPSGGSPGAPVLKADALIRGLQASGLASWS